MYSNFTPNLVSRRKSSMSHQPLRCSSGLWSLHAVSAPGDTWGLVLRGLNQVPQLRRVPCTCQLAVCRKHANGISEEVWWRCWHPNKPPWLPVVLPTWVSFFRSQETVFLKPVCERWGLSESGTSCFLVTFLLFTRQWHLQMEGLAEVAPGW